MFLEMNLIFLIMYYTVICTVNTVLLSEFFGELGSRGGVMIYYFSFVFGVMRRRGVMRCYRVYFIRECTRAPGGLLIGRGWHQNTWLESAFKFDEPNLRTSDPPPRPPFLLHPLTQHFWPNVHKRDLICQCQGMSSARNIKQGLAKNDEKLRGDENWHILILMPFVFMHRVQSLESLSHF